MTRLQSFLRQFRLEYRRTNPLTKAVVTAAIALATVALISLRLTQWNAEQKLAILQEQAAQQQQQNDELSQKVDALGTVDSIQQIAREELGLVDPDSIVFDNPEEIE